MDPLDETNLLKEIEKLRTARAPETYEGPPSGHGFYKAAIPIGQAEATLLLTLAIVRSQSKPYYEPGDYEPGVSP